jgi:DNA excision repair protein ERCC-3
VRLGFFASGCTRSLLTPRALQVSTDTVEMYYSTKRQQFLVDQGYSFKVVTNLFSEEDGRALMLSRRDEQLALLASVMAAGEDEAGEERLPEDADELREKDSALAPRRAVRTMAQISGAGNMAYMEFAAGGGRGGGARAAPRALGPPRAHHTLLRDRFAKR